jgi:hypothetical protein
MSIKDGGWPSTAEMQNVKAMRLALKAAAKNQRPVPESERRADKANAENQAKSRHTAANWGSGPRNEPWRDYLRPDGSIKTSIGDGLFGAVDKMSNNRR